jgi:hypothetical protein
MIIQVGLIADVLGLNGMVMTWMREQLPKPHTDPFICIALYPPLPSCLIVLLLMSNPLMTHTY